MHVFPQLRKLERKYPNELAVIGVHSPKFTAEKGTESIRKAVRRYSLEHPVVNDRDMKVWSQFGARAWPSLFVIDPQGKVLGKHEGEIAFQAFDSLLQNMIAQFDSQGLLDRTPAPGFYQRRTEGAVLSFPGKIAADPSSQRLFISDSSHHRIVVASPNGQVLYSIGSSEPGFQDGDLSTAQFDHPQGIAIDGDVSYVADTENHAIRRIDLSNGSVTTIAGSGEQARYFHSGGEALSTELNSPFDLLLHNGVLYIVMAGFHQLWALDLQKGQVFPYAGTGQEHIVDGPLSRALLAQPMGLSTDGRVLYFADSETSAVRTAGLEPEGQVETLVGVGLFDFGDLDGIGQDARLQHPQDVCFYNGTVYVADTYNNKIKRVDPSTRKVQSYLGAGIPGLQDGPNSSAQFHEPAGLSAVNGKLFIADTNNHAIRVADLESGEVSTLEIRG